MCPHIFYIYPDNITNMVRLTAFKFLLFFIMAIAVISAVDHDAENYLCVNAIIMPEYCADQCAARSQRNPKDVIGMKKTAALETKDVLMKENVCVGTVEECCCRNGDHMACVDTLNNWCRCNDKETETFPERFNRLCSGPSFKERYYDNFCNVERDEAHLIKVDGLCSGWACCFEQGCSDEVFAAQCPTITPLIPCPEPMIRFVEESDIKSALRFGRRSHDQDSVITSIGYERF